jgi:hypothetical protein
MVRFFALPLLALVLSTGCASLANSPEELRTTQRRIREIDGERPPPAGGYCERILLRNGAPGEAHMAPAAQQPLEILYAQQLTAETVEDVIDHGVALVEKQKALSARYDSLETKLSCEFLQLSRSAASWSTVKCLASIGLLLFLVFALFRRVL